MTPNLLYSMQYVMRDHYFPRDMRAPVLSAEYNQLAAYTALRMVTLKVRHFSEMQINAHLLMAKSSCLPLVTVEHWCSGHFRICDRGIPHQPPCLLGHLRGGLLPSSSQRSVTNGVNGN